MPISCELSSSCFLMDKAAADSLCGPPTQVTSNNVYLNASAFWSLLVNITEEARIPWVSIFGNHDDQPLDYPASTDIFGVPEGTPAQTDRDALLHHDRSFRFSMTQSMFISRSGANSVGYLLINRPPPDSHPAAIIWLLDTGGGSLQQVLDDVSRNSDLPCFIVSSPFIVYIGS